MNKVKLKRRIDVAAKREEADLVIKNGHIIDVFNQELIKADVAIVEGTIVAIGDNFLGKEIIDAENKFICPSFIDGHVHIESSMISPPEFSKVVLPHGVTTIIADPHEIANVSGIKGIQYMLDSSDNIPLNVYMMLPSCVPATPFENAGAVLLAEDLDSLYNHPRVLGLGEVMDYPSVATTNQSMMDKLHRAIGRNKKIDGHAAGLNNEALNIYAAAGIKTDHEAVTGIEAKERLKRGMYVIIRQGSVAKDLPNLIEIVNEKNCRRCLFGTDDKHIDDLLLEGSIDHNVRLAIKHNIDPIMAISMASLNAAECYGLTTKGAIAPGYDADLLILNNLAEIEIESVYVGGKQVAKNGRMIEFDVQNTIVDSSLKDSIHIPSIHKQDLNIPVKKHQVANIIEIIPNSLLTNHLVEEINHEGGSFKPCIERDHLKIVVIERHRSTGNIGLGIVKGLKLKRGAIATTIAHDSHNIIAAGTNDDDLLFAVDQMKNIGGGLVAVDNNKVLAALPLPISGLISDENYHSVYRKLNDINHALQKLDASSEFNPFLTLSFLALPVIPHLKITDLGIFDVTSFKHIPLLGQN